MTVKSSFQKQIHNNPLQHHLGDLAETIIETLREPLLILDGNLKVQMANNAFYEFFHVKAKTVERKYIFDIGEGEWNIPRLKELLEKVLPQNTHFNGFEVQHTFPHIGDKVLLLNARRIQNEKNETRLILLVMEDVTQRKELEKRKDDFINVASHELKTPVTTIYGYAQMLQRHLGETSDTQSLRYLHELTEHVNKLLRLMKYLLDATKIQEGHLTYKWEQFNFNSLLKETIQDFKIISPTHKIILKGSANKQIYGDKEHVDQVLRNLISNAIKYSPDADKIIITVSSTKDELTVSVQDFGIGISPMEQNRVFERFFRVGTSTGKVFSGLGLGLYVTAEILKRHGGRIRIESSKGKGSTFSFTLPIGKPKVKLALS